MKKSIDLRKNSLSLLSLLSHHTQLQNLVITGKWLPMPGRLLIDLERTPLEIKLKKPGDKRIGYETIQEGNDVHMRFLPSKQDEAEYIYLGLHFRHDVSWLDIYTCKDSVRLGSFKESDRIIRVFLNKTSDVIRLQIDFNSEEVFNEALSDVCDGESWVGWKDEWSTDIEKVIFLRAHGVTHEDSLTDYYRVGQPGNVCLSFKP